ncbi:WD domain repeat-containing protein 55 [Paramecium bursaria]
MNKLCQREQLEENRQIPEFQFKNFHALSSDKQFYSVQISSNEKFLGIGGKGWIRVYCLRNNKLIKIIIVDQQVMVIKFTNDSKYLLCGYSDGYLNCFNIEKFYKTIYKNQIHKWDIYDIIAIDNDQIITCSQDGSIIITDIKKNQQLLKIIDDHELRFRVTGIVYDESNQYIISCSDCRQIRFYNRKDGCRKFQQEHYYFVGKIQLIERLNLLVTSTMLEITIWQIDYQNFQLIQKNNFDLRWNYSFTSVLDNSRLVVIFDDCVGILDYSFNLIQSTKHNISKFYSIVFHYFQTSQLNSLNYIIVPGVHNLQILKRK